MRYIFIDRIQRLERYKEIDALKNLTYAEDVFADHFPGFPVMPGALMIETLAQTGTALMEVSENLTKKALLVMIEKAKFRTLVQPGDQLRINMKITSLGSDTAQMDGTIHVLERLVMDAQLTFAMKNVEEYYLPKTRHFMEALYDFWLKNADLIGFEKS